MIAATQYLVEGYRWQLVPAYFLAIVAAWLAFRKPPKRNFWSVSAWGLLFLTYALALALPYVLPIPREIVPTGPFSVGTTTFYLIDESRTDPYAPEPDTPREIMAQVWYPAEDVADYELARWLDGGVTVTRGISTWIEMPAFLLDHLVYAYSSAHLGAPVLQSEGPYPIILFSHGLGGVRAQNTNLAQELASHGYLVAALEHTYATAVTVFPDGRTAYHNPDTVLEGEQFEASFEALVSQWVEDQQFTLSTLERMNTDPQALLYRHVNPKRVMSMGHSTGGATAMQFCQIDSRCAAAIGLDPALSGLQEHIINDYAQPFLVMFSETWATADDNARIKTLLSNASAQSVSMYIEGTAHFDFSDLPGVTSLAYQLGLKGPIEGARILNIVNQIALGFFDHISRGTPADWLNNPETVFPEAITFRP